MHRSLRFAVLGALSFAASLALVPANAALAAGPSPAPKATAEPTPEPPNIAIPKLEAELKTKPNDKETLGRLAGYYLAVNQPDKALPLTQKLISLGVKSAQVYFLDGVASEGVGNVKQATTDFETASNLDPTNPQILLSLTDIYLRTNRASDAERVAKRAVTFNGKDPRVVVNLGMVLAQENKFDEARAQFDAAAKLDPKDTSPQLLSAKTYVAQKQYAKAEDIYNRVTTLQPNNVEALLDRARLLALENKTSEAATAYENILHVVTDDFSKAGVIDEEAHMYAAAKMDAQASAAFKRAADTYTKVPDAHLAYGDYLAAKGQFPAAVDQWKSALGPGNDNRDALFRLGNYAASSGDSATAITDFKRLDSITPNDPRPSFALGGAYMQAKQFQLAHEAYKKAFVLSRAPEALEGIAAADFQLKNYKEGAQILDSFNKDGQAYIKANPRILLLMGQTYTADGQKDKAKKAYGDLLGFVKNDAKTTAQIKALIAEIDHPAKK